LVRKKSDHGILHCNETYHVRCSAKRQHIPSHIFHH
jgi:hypothetical protein